MSKIFLTLLEKDALERGIATKRMRLKAGRVVWDELEEKLPTATGEAEQDAERLYAFKKMVEVRPCYEKRALKEWLEAQIDNGYPDVLDSDEAVGRQLLVYTEHLETIAV